MKKLLRVLFPFSFDIFHLGKYTTLAFIFGTVSVVSGIVLPIFVHIGSWWIIGAVVFGLAILYSVLAFTFSTLSFLQLWSLYQVKEDTPDLPLFDSQTPDVAQEDEPTTPPSEAPASSEGEQV